MKYDSWQGLTFKGLGNTITDRLVLIGGQFGLEGAEQFIPDDQHRTHVLIQVDRVGCMVYPMVRRRYENVFQPAQLFDLLCMCQNGPNLAGRIHQKNIHRSEPCQCNWNKKQEAIKRLQYTGAKAYTEIKM